MRRVRDAQRAPDRGAAPACRTGRGRCRRHRREEDRRRLLGHRHGRGPDQRAAITPSQDRLAALATLDGSEADAEYTRNTAARGENLLFSSDVRRGGQEYVSTVTSRSSPALTQKKKN